MFSFVPAGLPRSIAEYAVSMLAGAILLFAFFVASESAVLFLGGNTMVVTFLPVVCLMPLLTGVVSALALEKIRSKPMNFQRGALVGAAAGFGGTLLSSLMIVLVKLMGQKPFGTVIDSLLMVGVASIAVVFMGTLLAALGGALAVKFIKDV
jgi:hypothetical protein